MGYSKDASLCKKRENFFKKKSFFVILTRHFFSFFPLSKTKNAILAC